MTALEILTEKLKRPDLTDADRQLAIAEIEQRVKNHCHIDTVPPALCFTVANMAADLLRYELEDKHETKSAGGDTPGGSVTAISEGDTSVAFGKSATEADRERLLGEHRQMLDQLTFNYREQLRNYRKLRW